MSKIICDVCGTSYPETATQCPICGCVRSSDSVAVAGDAGDVVAKKPSSYVYVKGGRFSKSNVKKRNAGMPLEDTEPSQKPQSRPSAPQSNPTPIAESAQSSATQSGNTQSGSTQRGSATIRANGQSSLEHINKRPDPDQLRQPARRDAAKKSGKKGEIGLVITIIVLLLAIAGVLTYIFCSYLLSDSDKSNKNDPGTSQQPVGDPAVDPTEGEVQITGLKLAVETRELKSLGATFLLTVKTEPAGHQFELNFVSADPSVATVDSTGKVVATGRGMTTITVSCGKFSAKCVITCNFQMPDDPDIPDNPDVPDDPVDGDSTYKKSDLTFIPGYNGEYDATYPLAWGSVQLYNGKIPAELVEFSSDDPTAVTVSDEGKVTFLRVGYARITAKYEDWTISFMVRVSAN